MFSPNEKTKGIGVAVGATAHLEFGIAGKFARARWPEGQS